MADVEDIGDAVRTHCCSLVLIASGGLERWATAQTPAASSGGNALIGKLEGPEVIVDPAQFPKTFKEAPQLAELVKAGKLPPVAERIGQDPLVLKPVHELGKYGGMWRRGSLDQPTSGTGYTRSLARSYSVLGLHRL